MKKSLFKAAAAVVKGFGMLTGCHSSENCCSWWELPLPFFGFGVTVRYSDYRVFSTRWRPTSGDPLAIDQSLWIYRDRARREYFRGWAMTRPWARTYLIEIDLPGMGTVASESGQITLHPPLTLEWIEFVRRSKLGRRSQIILRNTERETPASVSFAVTYSKNGESGFSKGLYTSIDPGETCVGFSIIPELVAPGVATATIESLEYHTVPEFDPVTFGRLYGRPEFL